MPKPRREDIGSATSLEAVLHRLLAAFARPFKRRGARRKKQQKFSRNLTIDAGTLYIVEKGRK